MLSIVPSDQTEQDALKLDLDALVREGAWRMLLAALKAEVDEYIAQHADQRDEHGHALVVRHCVAEPRKVTTAAGELELQSPRVQDRREGHRFTSAILPPWARRSPKVTEVLSVLYLRGISTKDFEPALAEFFGTGPAEYLDHPAPEARVERGVGRLPAARPEPGRLRVPVGEWRAFQHPS